MAKHFNPSKQKVMVLQRDICSCSIIFIALNSSVFKSLPFSDHTFSDKSRSLCGERAGGVTWRRQAAGTTSHAVAVQDPWARGGCAVKIAVFLRNHLLRA